ncbi:MAG: hypothetical protein ABSD12_01880 [Paraburkholderia sp.]|jgi:hypothetical protein
MDHTLTAPNNALLATLIDQDIAHIRRVMEPALLGDLGGPILPPAYWRKRLHNLLDADHLTHAQLCAVDGLLLQLDQFDPADRLPEWKAMPLGAHESQPAPSQRVS